MLLKDFKFRKQVFIVEGQNSYEFLTVINAPRVGKMKVPLHLFFDFTSLDRSKCADFENEKGVFVELGAVLCPIVVLHEQSGNKQISDVIMVRCMLTTIT